MPYSIRIGEKADELRRKKEKEKEWIKCGVDPLGKPRGNKNAACGTGPFKLS